MEGVDVERTFSRISTARKLRGIADALETGKSFRVQINGRRVIVPGDLQLEVDFDQASPEGEIEIELRWDRKQRRATRRT